MNSSENIRVLPRQFLANRADDLELLRKAAVSDVDAVFIDLEDGVAPAKKSLARENVRTALGSFDYGTKFRLVRVNAIGSQDWREDLAVLEGRPDALMFPKVRTTDEVLRGVEELRRGEERLGLDVGSTEIFVMVETASAVLRLPEILTADPRVTGLFFGVADLTVDLGSKGIGDRRLVFSPTVEWCSMYVIMVARAVGLRHIVSPVLNSSITDMASVAEEAKKQFDLGFTAIMALTLKQAAAVNQGYLPTDGEEQYARDVVNAFEQALARDQGISVFEDRMLEAPFYLMAQQVIERAARRPNERPGQNARKGTYP